ncbi:MAG: hypothetical protein Q4D33_07315 [Prevotellaceae bacterium]|nr:hypothetical protein [Prevotellaceae bacterium]
MKTYKKPVSILIGVDAEELMAISGGQILDGGSRDPEATELGNGGYTGQEGVIEADAKGGFGGWE